MDVEEIKDVKEKVAEAVSDLMGCYYQQIKEVMDETDNGKIKVGFTVNLERSLVGMDMRTTIGFSKSVKDEREDSIDTNQLKMEGLDEGTNG